MLAIFEWKPRPLDLVCDSDHTHGHEHYVLKRCAESAVRERERAERPSTGCAFSFCRSFRAKSCLCILHILHHRRPPSARHSSYGNALRSCYSSVRFGGLVFWCDCVDVRMSSLRRLRCCGTCLLHFIVSILRIHHQHHSTSHQMLYAFRFAGRTQKYDYQLFGITQTQTNCPYSAGLQIRKRNALCAICLYYTSVLMRNAMCCSLYRSVAIAPTFGIVTRTAQRNTNTRWCAAAHMFANNGCTSAEHWRKY